MGLEGPEGEQRVQLVGLQVTADKLNTLIGKPVLKSDVKLGLKLAGPTDKLVIGGDIDTEGAKVKIAGSVDASKLKKPKFDVGITIEDIDTTKLLASEKVPPVTVERLHIGAKGDLDHGVPEAGVDVAIHLTGLKVKDKVVDDISIAARMKDRVLTVGPLEAKAFGQRVVTRGSVDLARKLVDMTLTVDADVGDLLARLKAAGMKVKTPVPEKALRLEEGVVEVRVTGHLEGELKAEIDIHGMSLAGGRVFADIDALLQRHPKPTGDQKAVELKDLDGKIQLRSVYLDPLLAWRDKKLENLTAAVWADIEIQDVPARTRSCAASSRCAPSTSTHTGSTRRSRCSPSAPWCAPSPSSPASAPSSSAPRTPTTTAPRASSKSRVASRSTPRRRRSRSTRTGSSTSRSPRPSCPS